LYSHFKGVPDVKVIEAVFNTKADDPVKEAVRLEVADLIYTTKMTDDERDTLIALFLDGFRPLQVARMFGVNRVTINRRKKDGLEKIKTAIKQGRFNRRYHHDV
jgi:DNA-directed RNA polymerase specialized sigma24 family protein